VEMAHFKKYSSFREKRYAFVRVKWQISVQPLHNIIKKIVLIGAKIGKTLILTRRANFCPR